MVYRDIFQDYFLFELLDEIQLRPRRAGERTEAAAYNTLNEITPPQ